MSNVLRKITKHLSLAYGEKFIEVNRYRLVMINDVEKYEVKFYMWSNNKKIPSFEIITKDTIDLLY